MKSMLLLVLVVMGGSAFADLIPFEVIRPMPLHRIGIDILAEVVGALAVGGLAIKQLVAKYEKMKKSEVQEIENERQRHISGDSTIAAGGEFVRIEEREGQSEGALSKVPHAPRWRELGVDERLPLESKLDKEMHVFESAYDKESGTWLREADLPSQRSAKRDEWWRRKCQELVFSVLLQDDELRGRLKGVPIEWILSRMDKPTKRTWTEWTIWQFVRLIEGFVKFTVAVIVFGIDCVGRICSSDYRQALRLGMKSGFDKRRMLRNRFRFGCLISIALIYLSGVITLASGVVGVEASCAMTRVLKVIFYPLLFLVGCFVFMFLSWIAWGLVLIPLNRWWREKKLKRTSRRRDKLFNVHCGERKWRIPVSDIMQSRQQMQLLPRDVVVGAIGSATDASLRLMYPGVARHHAEIYFDMAYHALGGDGFVMRALGRSWIGEYVGDHLPKKEKTVYLTVGREICVGPYAILKVVSLPSDKDHAFVFELVDGKRHEEKVVKMPQHDPTMTQQESSEDTIPFVCDVAHKQAPFVPIVLGRSRRSDVRLDELDVSGRHAEIVREGDQIVAVCLSRQGMFVNDKPVEPSGRRRLHEGDCMRIGKNTEVHVVQLPQDGDDVMVLNVTDSHGTREEEVRLQMVAEGTPRGEECLPRFGFENPGPREGDGDAFVCCDDGDSASGGGGMMCTKPVIYLYPQLPIRCSVRVRFDGALTCTYPAHGAEGWRGFVAAPDGTLTFPDGRKFYCLYWEGTTLTRWDFSKGYCVKGEGTAAFLADVLAKMGLSFREANEFIIYWLPRMQVNPYNVIAFQGKRYAESAKLEIEPQPDSILRVFMAWKASDCPVDIPAPDIKPFKRKGFTVVEWGGTEVEI